MAARFDPMHSRCAALRWRRVLIGAVVCVMGLAAEASSIQPAARMYTADDMLMNQDVGEIRFDPMGRMLAIEKFRPYVEGNDFSMTILKKERSELNLMALDANASLEPLAIDGARTVGYGRYSPDGRKVAVWWIEGQQIKAGVYDIDAHKLRRFDFLPTLGHGLNKYPLWISNDELLYQVTTPAVQSMQLGYERAAHEITDRYIREGWKGAKPSVTVLAGGDTPPVVPDGTQPTTNVDALVRVNATTGKVIELVRGLDFTIFSSSPLSADGRYLAITRTAGELPLDQRSTKYIAFNERRTELVLVDLKKNAIAKVLGDEGMSVGYHFTWSPKSSKLIHAAHQTREGKTTEQYYVYDVIKDKNDAIAPANLELKHFSVPGESTTPAPPLGWIGDTVMALARPIGSAADARFDWYALKQGNAPIKLTGSLPEEPKGYAASYENDILVDSGGDFWRVSADGRVQNLTATVDDTVRSWCVTFAVWRGDTSMCNVNYYHNARLPIEPAALARGKVALQTQNDTQTTGVLFLDLKRQQSSFLPSPAPDARLVALSAAGSAAVFRHNSEDGDRLILTVEGKPAREIWHFNQHLSDVQPIQKVMLTRKSEFAKVEPGEEVIDWLLLPPNYKPGTRLPVVVYFYPDVRYTREAPWIVDDIRETWFLNQNILAGKGYAILLASVVISPRGTASDPMLELAPQLIEAAQGAVEAGYVDPERWAIMGHSYGGYGTVGVLTQTSRFKAGIGVSGVYDLTSFYGLFGKQDRVLAPEKKVSTWVSWAENGQGRMGSPPWQDTERYVRNSPVLKSPSITAPVLLIHGDADGTTDVAQSELMFAALVRQSKKVEFARYWNEGHLITSPANIRDMWERIGRFLDEALGGK